MWAYSSYCDSRNCVVINGAYGNSNDISAMSTCVIVDPQTIHVADVQLIINGVNKICLHPWYFDSKFRKELRISFAYSPQEIFSRYYSKIVRLYYRSSAKTNKPIIIILVLHKLRLVLQQIIIIFTYTNIYIYGYFYLQPITIAAAFQVKIPKV